MPYYLNYKVTYNLVVSNVLYLFFYLCVLIDFKACREKTLI